MSKPILVAFAAALLAATPAYATGGMICRTAGDRPIELALVISHTAVPSVVSARLTEGGRDMPVAVAQSWLEPNRLLLDLTDRQALRHEARLNVRASGQTFDGSLWRNARRYWVRCREG